MDQYEISGFRLAVTTSDIGRYYCKTFKGYEEKMSSRHQKQFIPLIIMFVVFTTLIFLFSSTLQNNGFSTNFLFVSNGLLFFLSIFSLLIQRGSVNSPNAQKFVRGVYASMMAKMFICLIAVLVYMFINKEKINKPALFMSMGLYIFYTVIEVSGLMKAARKNSNA